MDFLLAGLTKAIGLIFTGDPETYSAVWTTVKLSGLSMASSLIIGIPLGFGLGFYSFPGKRPIRTVVDTLLSLPTVAIGLLVYAFLSHRGPLGQLGLLFTLPGMAIGQFILALPIVIALTATATEGLDRRLRGTLLTLGADGRQLALTTLWEARFAVLTAAVTTYGRVTTEVGISMMVGGNIKWHTRTITTAIALETGKGEFATGIALGVILILIAFIVNLSLSRLRQGSGQ